MERTFVAVFINLFIFATEKSKVTILIVLLTQNAEAKAG